MIHNGIEYGLLQAYAEGFELLDASTYDLDLQRIARLWNQGSVVRSWLLELAERALSKDPDLEEIAGYVEDSGEGRWTIQEAIDRDVPAVVLAYSLFARFRSRQKESFGAKLIAALRQEFGGHACTRPSGAERMTDTIVAAADCARPSAQLEPCCMVIFGASGDLTHRMLLPALYDLALDRRLPPRFAVVGFARTKWTDDAVPRRGEEVGPVSTPGGRWTTTSGRRFAPGPVLRRAASYDDPEAHDRLNEHARTACGRSGARRRNHLFYLAIPPTTFPRRRSSSSAAGRSGARRDGEWLVAA